MVDKRKDFNPLKEELYEIIFEADTPAGKAFDVILLIMILASVLVVCLESIPSLGDEYGALFVTLEWIFTIFFTIEYFVRLYSVYKPSKYALSFFGIIDLLAILPTYLSLLIAGTQYLVVIRALRLLRVFRIFKLVNYMHQGRIILIALRQSFPKILIFLFFVVTLVTIVGAVLYVVEGSANPGFSSIPKSIYWSIVTLTTVGYGDIAPITNLGQFLAAVVMLMGYAIIAVPTGIVSAELIKRTTKSNVLACRNCSHEEHDDNARFCKICGFPLFR